MMAGDLDALNKTNPRVLLQLNVAVVLLLLFCYVIARIIIGNYDAFVSVIKHLSAETKNPWIRTLWMLIMLSTGIVLFILRNHHRRAYALLEGTFAVTSGWVAIAKLPEVDGWGAIATLGAAIYLIVRALDNWREGVKLALDKPPRPESKETK